MNVVVHIKYMLHPKIVKISLFYIFARCSLFFIKVYNYLCAIRSMATSLSLLRFVRFNSLRCSLYSLSTICLIPLSDILKKNRYTQKSEGKNNNII